MRVARGDRRLDTLPAALLDALSACERALDARPWEPPDEPLVRAVLDALGPVPRLLRDDALAEARALRPDLPEGLLALEGEPHDAPDTLRARLDRAIEGAPATRSASRVVIDPARVVHVSSAPALRRHAVLAWRCAQSVAPMWMHVHPDDERPLELVDALYDGALETALDPRVHALRDALEREVPPADPALSALRAIVLAHDLVTQTEARTETTPLPDLCAYAWLDARPELVPDARSPEPPARAEAWFRWWLTHAIPAAWHST